MVLPNLIGCGAPKSGSTTLYHYLSEHPDIWMSPEKELKFFSYEYKKSIQWYEEIFKPAKGERIRGEFSPFYITDPEIPYRIRKLIPEARLLFVLRNPVKRAFSHYWHAVSVGNWPHHVSFSKAIRSPEGSERFLNAGFYAKHLEKYFEVFEKSQIHVIFTEELHHRPVEVMSDCYRFLGVNPSFAPDVERRYNVAATTNSPALLKKTIYGLQRLLRPVMWWIPITFRQSLIVPIRRLILSSLGKPIKPEPMSSDDYHYLSSLYREDIINLSKILERSLDWS